MSIDKAPTGHTVEVRLVLTLDMHCRASIIWPAAWGDVGLAEET
jgi:hypothetical protein